MLVDNQTAFDTLLLPGRMNYPKHSLTIVVKGTFDLRPNEPAQIAAEQKAITGDSFLDDEATSPYYGSDLVHFKPKADRMLVGRCYVPEGRSATDCQIRFGVGHFSKTLRIVGDRQWQQGLVRVKASDPVPFREMELRYDRSFGGPRYSANPIGRGYVHGMLGKVDGEALPNLEDPERPVKSPSDRLAPAGLGPLGAGWSPRNKLAGSYGKRWLQERCPWFPADLDWAAFNAAPADLQSDKYLRGDEALILHNLHPEHPQFSGSLPGLRVRVFLRRAGRKDLATLEPVEMNLDTLWVESSAAQLVLVWRGNGKILSPEAEDVEAVLVFAEKTDRDARSLASYEAELAPGLEAPATAITATSGSTTTATDSHSSGTADLESPPWSRESVEAAIAKEEKLSGANLAGLDLSELDFAGTKLREANLQGADLRAANLSAVDLTGSNLVDANLRGATLEAADLSKANLQDARLTASLARGAILHQANLENADARESDLFGACLSATRLVKCDFGGANLFGADLTDCDREGAQFSGANLGKTCLEGVKGLS
jgi:uncharacterized protein YjbI with pentapeptide repeats